MAYKVIVADQSLSVQKAAELALQPPEFDVGFFGSGPEAAKAIPDFRPDAVVVGLGSSGQDRYDLASFVRSQENGRQVALFFLRGAFELLDPSRISKTEYDAIIQKPFDGATFAALIRDTIDRKKEIHTLPEEPVLDEISPAEPSHPAAPLDPASTMVWAGDFEEKVRDIVRKEIDSRWAETEARMKDMVSAEIQKRLVAELSADKKKK
jgi:DNA-binding response OmpR family regulator